METNAQLVERLYPNIPILNAEQTASILGWDRKRIYNMAKNLPFVKRVGSEIVISKRALISWLDEIDTPPELLQKPQEPLTSTANTQTPIEVKKRVGRRRNSEKRANNPLSVLFATQLEIAAERYAYQQAIDALKAVKIQADDENGKQVVKTLLSLPSQFLADREAHKLDVLLTATSISSENNKKGGL